MSGKHPLDSEFNIAGTGFDDDFDDAVEIPTDPELQNLELVVKLALQQYKTNCDDMSLFDPKSRIKVMEINNVLLNTAKDARFKLESLALKKGGGKGKGKASTEEEKPVEGRTRSEIIAEATKLRAVK